MPGCAIVETEIDGVLHEYSTIEGVQEDVIEILLNLKGVAVKLNASTKLKFHLMFKVQEYTAADFQLGHDIEIANPEHVIANLNENGQLKLRAQIGRGRGYEPADVRTVDEEESRIIGSLLLDASYSPVRRVAYKVDSAMRVEQRTDLDKPILDLETNGTIDPEEAIRRAATILQQQVAVFVDLESEAEVEAVEEEDEIDPILLRPVDDLGTHGSVS